MSRTRTIVTGILLAGTAYGVLSQMESDDSKDAHRKRVASVTGVKAIQREVVVLSSGAKYRLSPQILDGTPADGDADNNAGKVQAGQELVVIQPAVNPGAEGWIGFKKPHEPGAADPKPDGIDTLADNVRWANINQLSKDGLAKVLPLAGGVSSLSAHVGEDGSISVGLPTLRTNVSITNGGNMLASPNSVNTLGAVGRVATSVMLPEGTYQEMRMDGLAPQGATSAP